MVSVLPLRADTTPDTRSNPEPCTLLPANTWVAVNVRPATVVVVLVVPVVPVVVVAEVLVVPLTVVEVVSLVVRVPNATARVPLPSAASCAKPTEPLDAVPLIS
jgi:hypothetical protein